MTLARAQVAAAELRTALLDHGVRQVSIELQPGVAGSGWGVAPFKRGMGHHIASRPSQGLTPGLATVKRGRGGKSPLTGPLANCYGGYDLTARIITLGWANHPGAGGPWPVPGWGTVPRDNGRPYILGWEFEGGYEPYTDEMHHFMACCGAGSLDWLGTLPGNPCPAPLECWGEHKDPWAPGRKVDRLGYTAASGRARIAAVRDTRSASITALEDPVMLVHVEPGQTVRIPVHKVPDGTRWWINIISGLDHGQSVYGKQVGANGSAFGLFSGHPYGTGAAEWDLYVGEGDNLEYPARGDLRFIEVTNEGHFPKGSTEMDPAKSHAIAVALTPVA